MFAQIIMSVSRKEIDRIFHYGIPDSLSHLVKKGSRVIIPFGNGNKPIEGYVIGFDKNSDVPLDKIKFIVEVLDDENIFDKELIELADFIKNKYFCTMSQCLQTIMPAGIKTKTLKFVNLIVSDFDNYNLNDKELFLIDFLKKNDGVYNYDTLLKEKSEAKNVVNSLIKKNVAEISNKMAKKNLAKMIKYIEIANLNESDVEILKLSKRLHNQLLIVEHLIENKKVKLTTLKADLNVSDSSIKGLESKGFVKIIKEQEKRDAFDYLEFDKISHFVPNEEQQEAIDFIKNDIDNEYEKPILLYGITGSGKTEIYIQTIDYCLSQNKQAIVLVPEISLTPQMVTRFVERFGNKVTVTHSKLTAAERFDQWSKAKNGEVSVVVGPRSAIFTPFSELGIIVIDEEHDGSYKSEMTPKYETKEVAKFRAKFNNATLILGTATPAVETYYKAMNKDYNILSLTKRATNSDLPEVFIKDMREELDNGNKSIFSEDLFKAISENLEKKEQTILFLNKRGHSSFVSCRKCGETIMCSNCNVSYTYHSNNQKLICHYCGKTIENPKVCPSCSSKYIKYFGIGTEKLQAEISKAFPSATVIRLDLDTAKKGISNILNEFSSGNADILVGTQMIAKGHHFPKVSLVGIVAADISLNTGDYKACENTFSLVTQVAGRAGREKLAGRVFVQTYTPENYSLQCAKNHDYVEFYNKEIMLRKMLNYPPFTNIFHIMFLSKSEDDTIKYIFIFNDILKHYNKDDSFEILGPAPAKISKIKNEYRWQIIVKYEEEERLRNYVLYCVKFFEEKFKNRNLLINLSLNPYNIF